MSRSILITAILAAASTAIATPALAQEAPPFVNAPEASAPAPVNLAVSYDLKFRLAKGTTLAELLLQAGVNADDATAADKLAAGHDGRESTGCFVRMSITKPLGSRDYQLQRLTLMTDNGQTVMERRGSALAISATGGPAKRLFTLV